MQRNRARGFNWNPRVCKCHGLDRAGRGGGKRRALRAGCGDAVRGHEGRAVLKRKHPAGHGQKHREHCAPGERAQSHAIRRPAPPTAWRMFPAVDALVHSAPPWARPRPRLTPLACVLPESVLCRLCCLQPSARALVSRCSHGHSCNTGTPRIAVPVLPSRSWPPSCFPFHHPTRKRGAT